VCANLEALLGVEGSLELQQDAGHAVTAVVVLTLHALGAHPKHPQPAQGGRVRSGTVITWRACLAV